MPRYNIRNKLADSRKTVIFLYKPADYAGKVPGTLPVRIAGFFASDYMLNTFLKLLCPLMMLFSATATGAPSSLRYTLGIKGGIDLFTVYGHDAPVKSSQKGWRKDAGASLFFRVGNKTPFSAQIELSYTKKGYRYHLEYDSEQFDATRFFPVHNKWDEFYRFDYVELPVLLNYRIPTSPKTRLQLFAGPTASFLLTAKETIADNETLIWLDVQSSTEPFDFGFTAGMSYEVRIWHGNVLADLRYCRGLLTTHRPNSLDYFADAQAQPLDRKNVGIVLMAGYSYDL